MEDVKEVLDIPANIKGKFQESLYRNNKRIRQDRADAIIETAQLKYKRSVEDLALKIKQQKRDLEGLLDLSPTTADSLVLASDFKQDEFVAKDTNLRIDIHNNEKKLEILAAAFLDLFGETLSV